MTAEVAIPTRNRGSMIQDCLRSILEANRACKRIMVIDQSDDDSTSRAVEGVAGGDPRVEIIRSERVGVSWARNLAAAHATSDVIAFVDDDCVVEPDWLDLLIREFEDPLVAAAFGRVVPPGFTTRRGIEIAFRAHRGRSVYQGHVPPWYVVSGAGMVVRRSAVSKVGGFDTELGGGSPFHAAEDLDLAYRFMLAGHRLVYQGAAQAYHKDWRDWSSRRKTERGYGIGAGAAFTKYIRSGDRYGMNLFARWMWELGVRRVGAGLLKWRSVKPMYLGYCQLVYPWIGAIRSLRLPVDRSRRLYSRDRERPEKHAPAPHSPASADASD